jgi:hypothetical protein
MIIEPYGKAKRRHEELNNEEKRLKANPKDRPTGRKPLNQ